MNPVKIDNPTLQPYRCLFCTAGHKGGPVIDMLVDVLEGRAYICLAHAKRIAITAGFAEGEELEKLANASVLLTEAEKGIAERDERYEKMDKRIRALQGERGELQEELVQARIALTQAENKLTELGQGIGATLAAVGSGSVTPGEVPSTPLQIREVAPLVSEVPSVPGPDPHSRTYTDTLDDDGGPFEP